MFSWQPSDFMLHLLLFVRRRDISITFAQQKLSFISIFLLSCMHANQCQEATRCPFWRRQSRGALDAKRSPVRSRTHNLLLGISFHGFCVTTRDLQGGQNLFSDSQTVTLGPLGSLCIRKVSAPRKCRCRQASQSCSVSAESLSRSHFTFAIKCSTGPTSLEPRFFFFFILFFFFSLKKRLLTEAGERAPVCAA